MKKFFAICLSLLICCSVSSMVLAFPAPGPQQPSPSPSPSPSPTPGGGGGGGSTPKAPEVLSYNPVVTVLHSVNAAFIDNGESVYFLPALEDFPADLVDTCADLTTDDGVRHQFAVVYDGYFNNEVVYNQAVTDGADSGATRLQTSKKVFSSTDNSRCLNLLGYDLLLSDERCVISRNGSTINFDYKPTVVGSNYLSAKTCIMDLYKAVGAYEWDVKVTYGEDINDITVDTSPVMQQVSVLTNDLVEGGIDTSEGACWVWASRTNPNLYWTRCSRDAIFDGGAHNYTKSNYIGNETSCTFSKNENDTVSFAEFCVMARAIMSLYGEPVITEQEIKEMIQLYAIDLPTSAFNKEQREAIEYLAAKGIIDPSTASFSNKVTFADIEEILLRIADADSRLIVRSDANFQNTMVQDGFVETQLSPDVIPVDGVEEITNPYDDNFYDYFIEAVDGYTNFTVKEINQVDYTNNAKNNSGTASLSMSTKTGEGNVSNQFLYACDSLRVRLPDGVGTTSGSGYYTYEGLEEVNGDYYYHFRIARELEEVTIYYDTGENDGNGVIKEVQGMTEYTLPSALGGVYNYSQGKEPHQTFDEANYSYYYMDAERFAADPLNLHSTESYLSNYTWILLSFPEDKFNKNDLKDVYYENPSNKEKIPFVDLAEQQDGVPNSYSDMPGGTWTVYVQKQVTGTSTDKVQVLIQCKVPLAEFLKNFKCSSDIKYGKSSTSAYYRHNDGTLLVSYEYLKKAGLVSSMLLPNDDTLILTLTRLANSNVSLNKKYNCIVVGDTIRKCDKDETLFYKESSGDIYINYKACLGWAGEYIIVNTDSGVIPVISNSHIISKKYALNIDTISVANKYPASSFNCAYNKGAVIMNGNSSQGIDSKYRGLCMVGTNPFSNYIIVESDADDATDHLFIIKRDNLKSPSGSITTINSTEAAKEKFKECTGISISVPEGFGMYYHHLNKTNPSDGFTNINYNYKTQYTNGCTSLGYVYKPKDYDDIKTALNDYAKDKVGKMLPIVRVNKKYYNLNMNTCTLSEYSEQEPLGNLPFALHANKSYKGKSMGRLEGKGNVVQVDSSDANLDQVKILPAAVGMFSSIKGFPSRNYKDVSYNLYYGSQFAKVKKGDMYINNVVKVEPNNPNASGLYITGSSGGMYAISDGDATMMAKLLDAIEEVEVTVTEPEALVDWSAYQFSRLVENLDSWSSIALIFILNILPRIAILLFFVLMLLSLIKNVRPWRIFCQKVFDIYSFLTFGKQNVDTIDMKRIFMISLICFSLFLIIMDGTLFNIIIWVCRFFISLWQH